ncbi:hypothetical protein JTE90_023190 [Oedothorax gibbosus]|uniref:protein-tyrosine-phosphatase n=1 Tax=Oedothorax gibbosus TaxID=931172 RepID=A0AAV6UH91_9ARAC|nr:hypothetical protein JTE90_023190 [Oedothorax gibbosus]
MRTKLFSFVAILLIGLQPVKTQPNNSDCDSPWNITIDGNHLTWRGDDRDANITVLLETNALNGTQVECSNLTLNVPFSEREVYVDSQCANSFHLVDATVVCNDLSSVEYPQQSGDVPGPPLNLSVVKVTNISISIQWLEPLSSASIERYNVQKSENKSSFTEKIFHTTETNYKIGGLSPYTNYYIRVRASNENGDGAWSSINQTTKSSIPYPIKSKHIKKINSTSSSIFVKWEAPEPSVGPILEYTISWEIHESPESAETKYLTETSYNIENLNAYTNYSIKVRARTEEGIGHWSGTVVFITDIGVPTVPRNLSVSNTSSTSILLSWEPPDPANGPILNYKVSWGTIGAAMSEVIVTETQYEGKLLKPYTEYMFQVAARTKAGLGSSTGVLNVWTDIDLPSQPINLTISEIRNTSIFLQWSEPEEPNGPLLPYLVYVIDHIGNNSMELESENSSYIVSERLLPYANYSVQVCAQTKAGRGEWTKELEFRTEIGIPSLPKNLSVPTLLPTRIFLNWFVPDSPAGPFVDYLVEWGVRGTELSPFVTVDTNYEAIGLRPYTEYYFGVAARTEAGVGESEVLNVRTDMAAPSVPGDISEIKTTANSIFITWTSPQHPNGPNILYLVQWAEASGNLTSLANTTSTEYLIEELEANTNYSVQVAAQNSVGQGPWTEMVYVATDTKGSAFNLKLILGLVLGLALPLLILIIVGIIITIRKGGLTFLRSISSPETKKKEPSPYQYDNPSGQMGVYNVKPKSLTVHNFEERISRPMYSSRIELVKEFGDLKENSPQQPCNAAKLEHNLAKNRWVKMLPHDHSRVKLFSFDDKLKPDFINANYIPGDSHLLEYIASQGPLKETVEDFWTMIWQQSVSVVVMLTQCVEKAVKNCEQYWPASGQSRIFGEIQVYTQSESVLTSYVVRVLAVQFRTQKRHVVHMHFSNWPVSGCPRTPDEFLHFVRKVREQTSDRKPGPLLVHCSAGVGRTGTFIAIDRIFQHLEHSEDIDIYGTVFDMRRYRPHMVQTEDQYTFIYACVKRYLQERKEPRESLYEVAL